MQQASLPADATSAQSAQAPSVDGMAPRYTRAPTSAEAVAATLREAAQHGWAVMPRGGGTKLSLGNPPHRLDLLLDMRGVSTIVEYTPADLTVTVNAGMRLADLQAELAQHGQMLALDPPYADRATIGGILAANDSGPRRLGYGTARDLVIGMKVAGVDGRLTRSGGKVVKNVTGYDLNKLYIGSLGTLAVIVEVSFKLHPLPTLMRAVQASFSTPAAALEATLRLTRSPLSPTAIALVDSADAEPWTLYVEHAGTPAALDRKAADTARFCREAGAGSTDPLAALPASAWSDLWHSSAADDSVRVKIAAPVTETARMIDAACAAATQLDVRRRIVSFAGSGIVYARLEGGDTARYVSWVEELRPAAEAVGGSLVIQQAPLALKRRLDVWGAVPSGIAAMMNLKRTYDPHRLLNPGRFVGRI